MISRAGIALSRYITCPTEILGNAAVEPNPPSESWRNLCFFRRIWDGNAVVVIVEGTEKKEEMRFSPYRLKIHGCRFHGYESVELKCREIEIISLAI